MAKTSSKMLRWPNWLPLPNQDGYQVEPQDRRVTTDMEIGGRFRVEFDTDETRARCVIVLDPIQAGWLETFERDLLSQGSKWFMMPLRVGGDITDQQVRFRERPSAVSIQGPYTTYSFALDLKRREGLMPIWLAELLAIISPYFLARLRNRLHEILHKKAPKVTNIPDNIWTATKEEWESTK